MYPFTRQHGQCLKNHNGLGTFVTLHYIVSITTGVCTYYNIDIKSHHMCTHPLMTSLVLCTKSWLNYYLHDLTDHWSVLCMNVLVDMRFILTEILMVPIILMKTL
jgi:hypothetical protein